MGPDSGLWIPVAEDTNLLIQPTFRVRGLFQYGLLHPGHRFGSRLILGTQWWPQRVHCQPATRNLVLGTFSCRIAGYLSDYAILS